MGEKMRGDQGVRDSWTLGRCSGRSLANSFSYQARASGQPRKKPGSATRGGAWMLSAAERGTLAGRGSREEPGRTWTHGAVPVQIGGRAPLTPQARGGGERRIPEQKLQFPVAGLARGGRTFLPCSRLQPHSAPRSDLPPLGPGDPRQQRLLLLVLLVLLQAPAAGGLRPPGLGGLRHGLRLCLPRWDRLREARRSGLVSASRGTGASGSDRRNLASAQSSSAPARRLPRPPAEPHLAPPPRLRGSAGALCGGPAATCLPKLGKTPGGAKVTACGARGWMLIYLCRGAPV